MHLHDVCTNVCLFDFKVSLLLRFAPLFPLSSSSRSSAVVPVQVCVEYEVLSYLHRKGLPVPKPYHLESREGVIGTEFFIMEYVDVSQGVFTDVFLCVCVCVCVCVRACVCVCVYLHGCM